MCRKNLLVGAALISFGAGVLFGMAVESWLLSICVCAGTVAGGIFLLRLF